MFKKEYLILFAVIIGACLYLYLKDEDRVHYRLPEPAKVEKAKITKIEIQAPQSETIRLEKSGGKWVIGATGFTADEKPVHDMTHALAEVRLTALVSDSGDYERYDLGEARAIRVVARSDNDTVLREMTVGKKASSGNYTFARIGDDPGVYHLSGGYQDIFDKTVDELRDKTVLAFDRDTIERVSITSAGQTLEMNKTPLPDTGDDDKKTDKEGLSGEEKESEAWTADDGRRIAPDGIKEIINTLSSLTCDGYLPKGAEAALTNPEFKIELTGEKTYTLSLFPLPKEGGTDYAGISSENPSAFRLLSHRAGRIMKKPSELLADETGE